MAGWALGVSIVSIIVATVAAIIAYRDLLTGRQVEVHAMLHDAEKLLVDHPDLMLAFTSSEMSKEELTKEERGEERRIINAELHDQIDMMILVCLNVFEAAYDVFYQTGPTSRWKSWQRTITEFVEDCPFFEKTWAYYGPQYDDPFRKFINKELLRL